MKIATDEQIMAYHEKAEEWLRGSRASKIFYGGCSITAKVAVAEYLANQSGLTLFSDGPKEQPHLDEEEKGMLANSWESFKKMIQD